MKPQKIEALYAWIVTEDNGEEGIPAIEMLVDNKPTMMPLIGSDLERIKSLAEVTQTLQDNVDQEWQLVKFVKQEVIAVRPKSGRSKKLH